MPYPQSSNSIQKAPEEKLFLNTIPFTFPTAPVTCWFSQKDIKGCHLKRIELKNRPAGIDSVFPNLKNDDHIYTSFNEKHEGMLPLPVNFCDHKNYYYAKRWYNGIINHHFKSHNLPVETIRITKDNRIWIIDKNGNKRTDCAQFDRFTLKVDWDDYNKRPQLVLSYDRPTLVYKKSVAKLLERQYDPFDADAPEGFTLSLVNRVFYRYKRTDGKKAYIIDKYEEIAKRKDFSNENAYPIMWPKLSAFLGMPQDDSGENGQDDIYARHNATVDKRYKKYYDKIKFFYDTFLNTEDLKSKIAIDKDGFAWVHKLQIGRTPNASQELVFGGGAVSYNPQSGINNGPFESPKAANIQLMFLFHEDDTPSARDLLGFLVRNGYKNFFKGLYKYTGKNITGARKGFHLIFKNRDNPLPEIEGFLNGLVKDEGVTYLAIYLTPHSKHTADASAKEIYYKVKKKLMDAGIPSQCIETDKMNRLLKDDEGVDNKGRERKNFAYTLQNMAIAINAKLGGIPWRISTEHYDELIVGVGAFRTADGTCYIGSAFSFENTGIFNSFNYFLKDEMAELAGSIEEAIINFTSVKGLPGRLIIHYYKTMREEQTDLIEERLHALNLDIPVYIVSINKTESEDKVLFDGGSSDLMPYSGRYVNLGAKRYLLCNNTRYYNAKFNPYDGFPFPVKLRIDTLNADDTLDAQTLRELIEQVYQFSRIYWKSVKQQNLPVTIKYPEMVAEMAPHFNDENIPEEFENRLWFL